MRFSVCWKTARSDCSAQSRRRQIPFSVALEIAELNDQGIQAALQKAYERKELRGKRLLAAKKLVEARRVRGKRVRTT